MIYENEDFTYNTRTGILKHNRVKPGGILPGDPCDNVPDQYGQLRVYWKGRNCMQSRVIWEMVHGKEPEGVIMHLDRDRGNNKLKNLRDATFMEVAHHRACSITNSSGVVGVYLTDRGVWESRITVNYDSLYLGCYEKFGDAVSVRKKAEKKFHFKVYGKCKNYGRYK